MTQTLPRRITAGLWLSLLVTGLLLANLAVAQPVRAANFNVGTYTELVNAINQTNTLAGDDTITLTANITLTGLLPDLTTNINILGNNHSIDGTNTYQIFRVTGGGLNITNLTFINGNAGVTSINSGGAIYNTGANLTITNSTFSSNQASSNSTIVGGIARGGAIFINSGSVIIANSTFSSNRVSATAELAGISQGGAIFNNVGELTITNSTFFNNSSSADSTGGIGLGGPSQGGAIYNVGTLMISNSTFFSNKTSAAGSTANGPSQGGAIYFLGVTLNLKNSIVANSTGGNNCFGSITDQGGNLQFPGNSCGATIPVVDPLLDLAGLQNNGGPTQTVALQVGSQAIDQIALANCPPTDQRGVARKNLCDIGAYEFNPIVVVPGMQATADLVGQLRQTPDRVAANDAENLIRYTFTVKNIGLGQANSVSLTLPIDPQLVIGFTEFDNPQVWVSSLTTSSVVVNLPALSNNAVVSGTIILRPNTSPVPAVGSSVSSRYTLNWTNQIGDNKQVWSNGVSFSFGAAGSNLDVSGGTIQLMSADAPNGSKIVYHSNFWIPNEAVTTWLTLPDGTSVALSQGNVNDKGEFRVEVDSSGLATGIYVVAAYGQRSQVYGSGILEMTSSGNSQAKLATKLGQKALGAKLVLTTYSTTK